MLSKGLRHQVSRCLASSSQHARATKAVPIKVISVSKGDSASVQALSKEWSDKISRYTPITHTNLRPNPSRHAAEALQGAASCLAGVSNPLVHSRASEPAAAAKAEGERILKQLQPQVCKLAMSVKQYVRGITTTRMLSVGQDDCTGRAGQGAHFIQLQQPHCRGVP